MILVLQFWEPDCMSSAELRKLSLQQTREAYQRREGDCGSSEVQGEHTGSTLLAATHGLAAGI